jgi:hypothetical protein
LLKAMESSIIEGVKRKEWTEKYNVWLGRK